MEKGLQVQENTYIKDSLYVDSSFLSNSADIRNLNAPGLVAGAIVIPDPKGQTDKASLAVKATGMQVEFNLNKTAANTANTTLNTLIDAEIAAETAKQTAAAAKFFKPM